VPESFGITDNTLAPRGNRYICPWARSSTPGYFDGGNKFDLARWDEAYFRRLKDFVAQASRRGIIVEMNLFCPLYHGEDFDHAGGSRRLRLPPFSEDVALPVVGQE
jgi:hypothetical protein